MQDQDLGLSVCACVRACVHRQSCGVGVSRTGRLHMCMHARTGEIASRTVRGRGEGSRGLGLREGRLHTLEVGGRGVLG